MRTALRATKPQRQAIARVASLPAPVEGWDAISPIADMPPTRALLLDNWFPQPGYIEIRKGDKYHASIGVSAAIETLMAYHGATTNKLFSAASTKIYDGTSVGSASSSVTGLTNARWQHINFTTTGGNFLWICNGADTPRYFDGTNWASVSITGISAATIVQVAAFKNRLWFALLDSTNAAYLGTDAIQGAATTFPLGGLFTKGGVLQAIATWALDGGNGPDDYIAFLSSKGQVAIYTGSNPASDFSLKGVYDLGAPIGRRCITKVGPDLAIISLDGVIPLSQALITERAAIANVTMTKLIQPVMNQSAADWSTNFGWQLISYPKGTRAIINVPVVQGSEQRQYVMNTLTGAWCRFLGNNANCWETFQDRLFYGGNDGIIREADVSGGDFNREMVAEVRQAFNYYGSRGRLKRWTDCRPLIRTDGRVELALGLDTDFNDVAISAPTTTPAQTRALWDSALWDVALWPVESAIDNRWRTVYGEGYCSSIRMKVAARNQSSLDALWGVAQWGVGTWGLTDTDPIVLQVNGFDLRMEDGF